MAEFDEKLNSLLSDPGAMSQIMQLAQSLSGGAEQSVPPQGQPPSPPPAPKSPDLLSALTGVSGEIAPFCSLYPTDINGDGLTEVPAAVRQTMPEEESLYFQWIEWYG